MGDSAFRKLLKILENPKPPAYVRQQQGHVIPLRQRVWQAIRPPAAVPSARPPLTTSQRRLLWTTAAVVGAIAAAWAGFDYGSRATDRARVRYDDGVRAAASGNFQTAVESFTSSIAIMEDANTYLQRGNAYKSLGQTSNALEDWSRAISINGELAEAYIARSIFYREKGDYEMARRDLDQSLHVAPTLDGYYQMGNLLMAQSNFEQALENYNRAIELMPTAPYIYVARARARRALGDEVGADADVQEGLLRQKSR